MATTPMADRPHLSVKPLWAPHFELGGAFPVSPLKPSRAHIFSPSPRSPKALPTPVLPSAASHDGLMRQHERALVERLDQRVRQTRDGSETSPACSTPVSRPISPTDGTKAPSSTRPSNMSLAIPNSGRPVMTLPTPASPANGFPRRQTLVAETRSMLLAGLGENADRRQSAHSPMTPAEARKLREVAKLEQLRAWGPVYYGDTKTADVFVQAVSLRRPSEMSSNCSEASHSAASSPQLSSRHITVRARVRPRDIDRKPFGLLREFDVDELRATVPDPLPTGYVPMSPMTARTPTHRSRQSSILMSNRRRSSVARRGSLVSSPAIKSGHTADVRAALRGANAIPMHIEYARVHAPVLAALMISGHVEEGDTLDVPMPRPEAWPATVAYMYTGQDEPTEAVRQNITYLAGKVPLAA